MRNFIILTTVTGKDISINIDDIVSIVGNWEHTTVYFDNDGNGWNVKESVQEIVKRINELNNNEKTRSGTKSTDWAPSPDSLSGIELIRAERERQINELGYTSKHDDVEKDGGLSYAAICYAIPDGPDRVKLVDDFYPWHIFTYRPTPDNRIKELVKAGALIAAEIDRLQRLK